MLLKTASSQIAGWSHVNNFKFEFYVLSAMQEAVFRATLVGRGITAGSRPSRVFLRKIKRLEQCRVLGC